MKYVIAVLALAFSGLIAHAQYPEMSNAYDAEQVVQNTLQPQCSYEAAGDWTCFARDARGGAMGVSSSFTSQALAAGRALASCQRKSSIPNTCHITSCKYSTPDCGDHGSDKDSR